MAPGRFMGRNILPVLRRRLINTLTAQTNYGALYQVDMRLRPSGRAGPLATQLDGFRRISRNGGLDLGAHGAYASARRIRLVRIQEPDRKCHSRHTVSARVNAELIAGDVVEMRSAIAKEKGDKERWDLKYVAGGLDRY